MALAKSDMESMARRLRAQLNVDENSALDPFFIQVDGVRILGLDEIEGLTREALSHLRGDGASQWSAMSVPLDGQQEKWVVILNSTHDVQRRRVSLLEELWHILQGHKLTSIAKIGSYMGRSFETEEEHDAYYLAAATLVPSRALKRMVRDKASAESVAEQYGVSRELVEYRIKRLGLWNEYKREDGNSAQFNSILGVFLRAVSGGTARATLEYPTIDKIPSVKRKRLKGMCRVKAAL